MSVFKYRSSDIGMRDLCERLNKDFKDAGDLAANIKVLVDVSSGGYGGASGDLSRSVFLGLSDAIYAAVDNVMFTMRTDIRNGAHAASHRPEELSEELVYHRMSEMLVDALRENLVAILELRLPEGYNRQIDYNRETLVTLQRRIDELKKERDRLEGMVDRARGSAGKFSAYVAKKAAEVNRDARWLASKVYVSDYLRRAQMDLRRTIATAAPYPEVPTETTPVGQLPGGSGVYFLWEAGMLMYVGQARSISSRVSRSHAAVFPATEVSWVPLPVEDLNYAEAYYIGVHKPPLNFGGAKRRVEENLDKMNADSNVDIPNLEEELL